MANVEIVADDDRDLDLPVDDDVSGDGVEGDNDSPNHDTKDPSDRARIWQSRHDKKDAALKKALAENEDLKSLKPMQQLFAQKPELLSIVEAALLKQGAPKEIVLERPEAPRKPLGYDEAESVTNPESLSFKYRMQKEEYLERLAEYQDKMIEKQQVESRQKTTEMETRIRERETDVEIRGKLAAKGIVGDSADRFIDNFSKPGKLSFDDLVKFHFLKEGKKVHGVDGTQPRPSEFEPAPLLKAGGGYTDEQGRDVDPAKAFSSDLARGSRSGLKKLFD